jgi:hypothetical protein
MGHANTNSDIGVRTNVTVTTVNTETGAYKRAAVKNVTCVGGHEIVASFFGGEAIASKFSLAIGDAGGNGTSVSDRELNNEVGRTPVNIQSVSGTTATLRAFVPSLKQFPTNITEIGIALDDGDLVNHAQISPRDLSGTDTLLVGTIDLTIGDVT